jgi:hypothetical protein
VRRRTNRSRQQIPSHPGCPSGALPSLARTTTPLGGCLRGLLARAHGNPVIVALASKLIRIAWALLRNETRLVARRRSRGVERDQLAAHPAGCQSAESVLLSRRAGSALVLWIAMASSAVDFP